MSTIHRIALASLLLSTPACGALEGVFAPKLQLVQPAEESADTPTQTDSGDLDGPETSSDAVASVPVSTEAEVLAVRNIPRTAEHDRLEALAGHFEVQGSFHPRPNTNARSVEGTLENTWIDETASLEGVFEGTLRGTPFSFVSETGYDPMLSCWVETWRSQDGTPIRALAPGYEDGDGCIVTVRQEDGRNVRDETRLSETGIVRRVWRTTADGVEYLSLELTGQRVD